MTEFAGSESSAGRGCVPALAIIEEDLDGCMARRRLRFGVAFGLGFAVLIGLVAAMGIRPDFPEHSVIWGLTLAGSAVVSFMGLPAIGAGIWFPSTAARFVLLAAAALGLGLVVAASVSVSADPGAASGACVQAVAMSAAIGLSVAVAARAFVQRRSWTAVGWTACGVALGAMAFVTSLCSSADAGHIVASHTVPMIGALLIGLVVGLALRRLQRRA